MPTIESIFNSFDSFKFYFGSYITPCCTARTWRHVPHYFKTSSSFRLGDSGILIISLILLDCKVRIFPFFFLLYILLPWWSSQTLAYPCRLLGAHVLRACPFDIAFVNLMFSGLPSRPGPLHKRLGVNPFILFRHLELPVAMASRGHIFALYPSYIAFAVYFTVGSYFDARSCFISSCAGLFCRRWISCFFYADESAWSAGSTKLSCPTGSSINAFKLGFDWCSPLAGSVCCSDFASSVFSKYFSWIFEGNFRRLVFAMTESEFAVSTVLQFLCVALQGVNTNFGLDDRVCPGKPLLAALWTKLISFIGSLDIPEIVLDSDSDLAGVLMVWKTWTPLIGIQP